MGACGSPGRAGPRVRRRVGAGTLAAPVSGLAGGRPLRPRRVLLAGVPGHQVADYFGCVPLVRITCDGGHKCCPEDRREPEGVAGTAFRGHENLFLCRDTRDTQDRTVNLRCRATRSRLVS